MSFEFLILIFICTINCEQKNVDIEKYSYFLLEV